MINVRGWFSISNLVLSFFDVIIQTKLNGNGYILYSAQLQKCTVTFSNWHQFTEQCAKEETNMTFSFCSLPYLIPNQSTYIVLHVIFGCILFLRHPFLLLNIYMVTFPPFFVVSIVGDILSYFFLALKTILDQTF